MKKSHLRIMLRLLLLSFIVCVIIAPCVLAADNGIGKSCTSKDELVLTPGGSRLASQVHEVKPGEILRLNATNGHLQKISPSGEILEDYGVLNRGIMPGNISTQSKVEHPFAGGWITYVSWTRPAGTLIDSFDYLFNFLNKIILENFKRIL